MWNFIIPAITGLASVMGGAAKSSSDSRGSQANFNAVQDRTRSANYGTQQDAIIAALKAAETANMDRAKLDLDQRKFQVTAPGERMSNSARGSMMANAQDVSFSGLPSYIRMPQVTGGARPSMLSPESRQLGSVVARQALVDQMKGDKFDPVAQQNWGGAVLPQPGVSGYPQAGTFEKIAGAIGMGGGALDAIMRNIQQYGQGKPQQSGALTPEQGGWTPPQF